MSDNPEQFVIVEHSSYGDQVEGGQPYHTEAEALAQAQEWARDNATSNTPVTLSVHRLSEPIWEG